MADSTGPTAVLVHGAFADASGFGGVIRELATSGYEVVAPPNPLLSATSYPTMYDAPGAPEGPDLYISKAQFRETFCADVPVDVTDVMFATQRPLSLAALTEKGTAAGWRMHPSWFLVSEQDNAIPPDAERFMAERMKATTDSISGSHTAFIAQPVRVASFIKKALMGDRAQTRGLPGGDRAP